MGEGEEWILANSQRNAKHLAAHRRRKRREHSICGNADARRERGDRRAEQSDQRSRHFGASR